MKREQKILASIFVLRSGPGHGLGSIWLGRLLNMHNCLLASECEVMGAGQFCAIGTQRSFPWILIACNRMGGTCERFSYYFNFLLPCFRASDNEDMGWWEALRTNSLPREIRFPFNHSDFCSFFFSGTLDALSCLSRSCLTHIFIRRGKRAPI